MSDFSGLVDEIASSARTGDRIVVMSNGDFGGIHEKLLEKLGARARAAGEPLAKR